MAATYSTITEFVAGNKRFTITKMTGDASYPTGGYDARAATLRLGVLEALFCIGQSGGFEYQWDQVNNKIRVMYPQGGSSGGTNDGSGKVTAGAASATAVDATTPDVNTAPAREVQAGANLTGASWIVFAVGS